MRIQDLLAPQAKFLKYTGGCGTCPRQLKDFVPATLRKSKLILVGEAPGENEVEKGEGFVGKSGTVLRTALKNAGITDYALSNTIHCRPPDNRDPQAKEISCCMNQHVTSEVAGYPYIVLVGNIAQNAFYPGEGSVLKGNLAHHPDFPNSRFYGMLHPAAIGYDNSREGEFYAQVERLARILNGDDIKFKVVQGMDFVERFKFMLQASKLISFDLETSQLESWIPGGKIRSLAVAPVPGEEVFVMDSDDNFFYMALKLIQEYLEDPEKQVMGHNLGFDLVWMESELDFKCNLKHIHDTQHLFYLAKGYRQSGLKRLVSEHLDGYRHLVLYPHRETNLNHLRIYNAEDVYYTQKLFLKVFPELKPTTRDLSLTIGGPSTLALRRVQHAGIHFRAEVWEGLVAKNRARRKEAVAAWALADPLFKPKDYIHPEGTKDIAYFLYDVRKYPVLKETPHGDRSTDEEVIHSLIRGGAKELEHLLTIREVDKEYSTYLKPYPKLVCPSTGRIHSSYHNTTVKTGRLSSSEPNMQNQPHGAIRGLFGAPLGWTFCQGDWSQIELRIAMSEANEPNGIAAYLAGKDLHEVTAQVITGRQIITKKERTDAKPVNFCLIYGGSPETLRVYAQNEYGIIIPVKDSEKWHREFFQLYSKLPDWHGGCIQKLRENRGYMESAVGHIWYYPDWDSQNAELRMHAERAALNMQCQGPAAYFTTYLIYLCQQAFHREKLFCDIVLTVHDQLAWEAPDEAVPASIDVVREQVKHIGSWASWMKCPVVLDIETGQDWNSLEKWVA